MRIKKRIENDFTTVHNAFLRDQSLGIRERGLLITMLSLPDDWDFSIRGLAMILPDGEHKIGNAIRELEKHGYIMRERVYECGKIIDWNYIVSDSKIHTETTHLLVDCGFVDVENQDVNFVDVGNLDVKKLHMDFEPQSNTKESNTNISNINQSINHAEWIDMMDRIKSNISYDLIVTDDIRQTLDELVELIVECCMSINSIRVGKQEMPAEVVKSRMLKLNSEHIVYVLGCMEKNHSKITNIRSYLITVLYNAVTTMDNYYRAEVNYDINL